MRKKSKIPAHFWVEIPSRADPGICRGLGRTPHEPLCRPPVSPRGPCVARGHPGRPLERQTKSPRENPPYRPTKRPTQCPAGCPPIGGHPAGHSVGHCVGRRAPGLLGRPGQRPPLSPPVARGSSCRPVSPRVPRVAPCRPVSPVSPPVAPYRACRPARNSVHISVHLQVDGDTDRVCGRVLDKHRIKGRKAGFSGTPEIEVSCASPARK